MKADFLAGLVITRIDSVSTLFTPQGNKLKRSNRRGWALVIKYEGETVYHSGEKTYLSDGNHVLILPKGCSYEWECTKEGHFSIVEFESELTYSEPLCFFVKDGESYRKRFWELECLRTMKGDWFEMKCLRDTYSVLLMLLNENAEKYTPNHKRERLRGALEYISRNYNQNIKNDTLSRIAGMSTVYFRKLFTETVGISPIAYAKRLRIEKAKEMLKSDYGTLSDLALSLGYSGLYAFSRDFKKHTGIPPSRY